MRRLALLAMVIVAITLVGITALQRDHVRLAIVLAVSLFGAGYHLAVLAYFTVRQKEQHHR